MGTAVRGESETDQAPAPSGTGHLFISYSRNDKSFISTFVDALKQRGLEVWVDWEGIAPSEEWMSRIFAAIGGADAFVFLISPDSVNSEVCGMELEYAVQNNKRILPVLHRDPDGETRSEIAELNWVFARNADSIREAIDALEVALNTDLDWVREHSRVLVRAREWDKQGRESSYTLRGRDLRSLQLAVSENPDRNPQLTALQRAYLEASRRAESRRKAALSIFSLAGIAVAAFFAFQAWSEKKARVRQAEVAAAQEIVESGSTSTRALINALVTLRSYGEATLEAATSLRDSINGGGQWVVDGENRRVLASDMTANGKWTALYAAQDTLLVYDSGNGAISTECSLAGKAMNANVLLSLSEDARYAAVLGRESNTTEYFFRLNVWSLPACELMYDFPELLAPDTEPRQVNVLPGGNALMLQSGKKLYSLDATTGELRKLADAEAILAFDVSPDGGHYVTAVRGEASRPIPARLTVRNRLTHQVESEWLHPRMPLGDRALNYGAPGISIRNRAATLYSSAGQLIHQLRPTGDRLAWSPTGDYFASSEGDPATLSVRDSLTGKIVARTRLGTRIGRLGFTSNGQSVIAVGDSRSNHAIWRFTAGGHSPRVPYAVLAGPQELFRLAFSADSTKLLASGTHHALAWEMPGSIAYTPPRELESSVPDTAWTVASAGTEAEDGQGLAQGRTQSELRARISSLPPDRRGTPRLLEFWRGEEKVAEKKLSSTDAEINPLFLQFSPDDRFLVYDSGHGWAVVAAETLVEYTVINHPGAIDFTASASGEYMLSRDSDQVVMAWKIGKIENTAHARLDLGLDGVRMAISDDGRWMAMAGPQGEVWLWALGLDELLAQACHWAGDPCN